MDFLEKDLEDIIYDAASKKESRLELRKRGLDIRGRLYRQVNLGDYGIADLIAVRTGRTKKGKRYFYVNIIELKKETLDIHVIAQICRYKVAVVDFLCCKYGADRDNVVISIDTTIIGSKINYDTGIQYVVAANNSLKVLLYEYKLDGIHFKNWNAISDCPLGGYGLETYDVIPPFSERRILLGSLDEI